MTIHDYILGHGFESTLDVLITHAETQAKLHQSLSDRDQWLFWVRTWANLQRAADAIALGGDDQECLAMWTECQDHSVSALDFDFSDND